ncbi:hypothetical protein FGO68_gene4229 [Halteria grandinella]|uniref:Uncharacterized protein n=1 Tax=Halteria grandinella TaxID=5974 RepID=A0A8J8SUY1_HALGN|nr:hypothetical protein FGO68_gene4229 [Halteria grandinella]
MTILSHRVILSLISQTYHKSENHQIVFLGVCEKLDAIFVNQTKVQFQQMTNVGASQEVDPYLRALKFNAVRL